VLMTNGAEIYAVNGGGQFPFRALPLAETVEIYNIADNAWRYGPPVRQPLSSSAGGLAERKLMIQGGVDDLSFYPDVQVSELVGPCSATPGSPTPTDTPTISPTPTSTPTPTPVLVGHVTWQGIPQPDSRNNGITATLTLCVGGTPVNRSVSTDAGGFFTVTTGLSSGTFAWSTKGVINLANSGTLVLSGGTTNVEMGLMRAGDCNNSNIVNAIDFTTLKNTFGKALGDPGYDGQADFNRDNLVSSIDFNLQQINFGQAGASLTCP
jgi:hypothetical protein